MSAIVGPVAIDRVTGGGCANERLLGGSAVYAAMAASYFSPTTLVSIVGADFPASFRSRLRNCGIDLSRLQRVAGQKTLAWEGAYSEHGECETVALRLNSYRRFCPNLARTVPHARHLMLSAGDPELQLRSLSTAASRACCIVDTRDIWIKSKRSRVRALLDAADVFLLNEGEARLLAKDGDVMKAGAKLHRGSGRIVIVKRGAAGSLLFHPQGFFSLPAAPVRRVIDPTGAGDSFGGALIGYLASVNRTDLQAFQQGIAYATACASFTVQALSTITLAATSRQMIRRRAARLPPMRQFAG